MGCARVFLSLLLAGFGRPGKLSKYVAVTADVGDRLDVVVSRSTSRLETLRVAYHVTLFH